MASLQKLQKAWHVKHLPYEEIQKGSSFLNPLCYVLFESGRNHYYGLMMGNKLKSDNPKGNLLRNTSASAQYDVANEKHTFIELLDEKKPELRPHHPSRSSA
jgi:hypothetical protein